ncbi:UDP-glucose 4-epimerase GalE [Mogibacterium pumilum]|uniref:UDP-glucose 4-epimerase n=1 Tax=Mogibacterium pumilum TaxID=86332 RepID=A0A223ARU6_9FIRM|nr:UDP-glucose 4-epimerase GalE [Mogibacterium pumilum]ASS37690.1 UDP-glucose 4-epimerase GalE [Mogibacterium pumilum]
MSLLKKTYRPPKVLLAGGAGYIGSHVAVELLEVGYDIVIADNFSNSCEDSLQGITDVSGKNFPFYNIDVGNSSMLTELFEKEHIDIVIHLAGYKSVSEAINSPLKYYKNNIIPTLELLEVMQQHDVRKFILSSSANVYGESKIMPVTEECKTGNCTNPYGRTKWIQEEILKDLFESDSRWNIVLLRYFNPAGAHSSGLIGERYNKATGNIMPSIALAASGEVPAFKIMGNSYNTPDGTGIRDYIHISDLARGHVAAINKLYDEPKVSIYNLGTGCGYSVLEAVKTFEKVCGHSIPCEIEKAREGDIAEMYACCDKIKDELGWEAIYSLEDVCESAWAWNKKLIKKKL